MVNQHILDVLVVYSANAAVSASATEWGSTHPFRLDSKEANYNLPYAHFLETCKKRGLNAGFTTSADIIAPGTCHSYWTYHRGQWQKVLQKAYSTNIFDKISPTSAERAEERSLLLSSDAIQPLNDRELYLTFFDKLRTAQKLARYSIPTVSIGSNQLASVEKSLTTLRARMEKHGRTQDFLTKLVLKDRFGAGGNHVYEIDGNHAEKIHTIMTQNPDVQFILQPFLAFDSGFTYQGNQTATDIRLIFHHNKLLQCYLRIAKADDFRCNEHQGGKLIYVTPKDIPAAVLEVGQRVVKRIDRASSLYALDFVISNSGQVYFLEGNFGPGLDWNVTNPVNERMSKQLIVSIADEFAARIGRQKKRRATRIKRPLPLAELHLESNLLVPALSY